MLKKCVVDVMILIVGFFPLGVFMFVLAYIREIFQNLFTLNICLMFCITGSQKMAGEERSFRSRGIADKKSQTRSWRLCRLGEST